MVLGWPHHLYLVRSNKLFSCNMVWPCIFCEQEPITAARQFAYVHTSTTSTRYTAILDKINGTSGPPLPPPPFISMIPEWRVFATSRLHYCFGGRELIVPFYSVLDCEFWLLRSRVLHVTFDNQKKFEFELHLRSLLYAFCRQYSLCSNFFAATPHWQDPTRSKQLSTVAILCFQLGRCDVVVELRLLRRNQPCFIAILNINAPR